MMWPLSREDAEFRQEVCAFFRDLQVPDDAQAFDRDAFTPKHDEIAEYVKHAMVQRGWWGVGIPIEYGGARLSPVRVSIVRDELIYHHIPNERYPQGRDVGLTLVGPALLRYGTEEQRQEHLPRIADGSWRYWQTMTEPDAGSDLASLRTRAVRQGETFVVNGSKVFIGEQTGVDWLYTAVRTSSDGPKHHGITVLLIDPKSAGVQFQGMTPLAGNLKQAIFFTDVRVPAENAVGPVDHGWAVVRSTLDIEHGGGGLGGGEYLTAVDATIDLLREEGVCSDDAKSMLGELFVRIQIERLLGSRNLLSVTSGKPLSYEGPQLSLYQKTSRPVVTNTIVELLGLRALVRRGSPGAILNGQIEHLTRAALASHPGGTPEMQKRGIARALGLPKD